MSEEQANNSLVTVLATPSDVTEQEAFDCYRRMEKPTLAAVAEHFTDLGRNLSCSRIKKWATKGNWCARLDLSRAISAINPATLGELAKLASEPTVQLKRGLAYRVIIRLAFEIDHLEVRDMADFARLHDLTAELLKTCSRLGDDAISQVDGPITFKAFERFKRE